MASCSLPMDNAVRYIAGGLYLTVMDNSSTQSSFPLPYAPPFQIKDDRLLYSSSTSKKSKKNIYSGGVQRREPELGVDAGDVGLGNDLRPFAEGGSWRGNVNGKERAVSWSLVDPLNHDIYALRNMTRREYAVYIGGKFGILPKFNDNPESGYQPINYPAMAIAGICLIDPKQIVGNQSSTAKYAIAVIYKTDNKNEYIAPYVVTYQVELGNDDRLVFTQKTVLILDTLPSNYYNTQPQPIGVSQSEGWYAWYYVRDITGFSSDGLHFCTIGFKPTNTPVTVRNPWGKATVELISLATDFLSYSYSVPWQSIEYRSYYESDYYQLVVDYDRFCIAFGMLTDSTGTQPLLQTRDILELKPDGTLTTKVSQLGGIPQQSSYSQWVYCYMTFMSTKLNIYQYYLTELINPSDNEYKNTLVTWVDGVKYEDNIHLSLACSNVQNQTVFGTQGQPIPAKMSNWMNAAYTNKLVILGTFDPYIQSPTYLIDFKINTHQGVEQVSDYQVTKITNNAEKIDVVYPPELLEAGIVSPISLIHLPY